MAWQTPFTNWSAGNSVTADDMNRICGNLNYLLGTNTLSEAWTAADYVYVTDWHDIRDALGNVQTLIGMEQELPDDETSSYNFNLIETYCETAKPIIDLMRLQTLENKFAGEWYADNEIYVGGHE